MAFQALSYLSPIAGLPFGAASTTTASLPAGFRGRTLAVFLQDDQARGGYAADRARPEPPSTGRRTLQNVERKERVKCYANAFCPPPSPLDLIKSIYDRWNLLAVGMHRSLWKKNRIIMT